MTASVAGRIRAWLWIAAAAALVAAARGGEPPRRPDAGMLFQQAWYLEEGLRQLGAAIKLYERIVSEYPDETSVVARSLLRLGGCYERLGHRAKAREIYWRAYKDYTEEIQKLPAYHHQDVRIARKFDEAFSGGGDQMKVMDFVKEFLDTLPLAAVSERYDAWRGEAIRLRKTDPVKAIDMLRKTIALGMYVARIPDPADLQPGAGSNHPRRASASALHWIHDTAYLQKLIGETYLEIDMPDQAIREFRRVHEDFPTEREQAAWAQMSIAEIYRQINQVTEAIEVYSQLPVTHPDQKAVCAWAKLWMGDCFRELGELAKAYDQWETVLDFAEEPDTRWPRRVARWLLGKAPVPEKLEVKGFLANDVAYFAGVKYELDGLTDRARGAFKASVELSDGPDWPGALARRLVELYESSD